MSVGRTPRTLSRIAVVAAFAAGAACGGSGAGDRDGAPAGSAALRNSLALPDGSARDSTARDSTARDSTGRDTTRRDTIIGRDSAFGPTHTIDASGKITPIPKRPPRDTGGD